MKRPILMIGCLLLVSSVRADVTPSQEQRAHQINMDLKQDIVNQPTDSKKVTKLRGTLRDKYADYIKIFRTYGTGTPQSKKSAREVMEAQKKLHRLTDPDVSEPETQPQPVVEKKAASDEPMPTLTKDSKESDETSNADDTLYNDIVKEYGKDSPQAEALRHQLGSH